MPASLFLHWFEIEERAGGRDFAAYSINGWAAFEGTDALMVLAATGALALVVSRRSLGPRFLLLGALASGWILVQLIDGPPGLAFLDHSEYSLGIGAWLGLLGALLVAGAGALIRAPREPAAVG